QPERRDPAHAGQLESFRLSHEPYRTDSRDCGIRSGKMKYLHKQLLHCVVYGCALLPVAAMAAGVEFPQEAGGYKKSDLPGYKIASGLCLMCHSSQYASSQPPKSSPAYWNATIH